MEGKIAQQPMNVKIIQNKNYIIPQAKSLRIYLILIIMLLGITLQAEAKEKLKLAVTTSIENSGILSALLPPFEKKLNVKMDVLAVGTGKALELGKNGDIDIVLVHNKEAEDKFIKNGFGVNHREVMHNNFIIVGPKENPAGVKGNGAVDSFLKIAMKKCIFISRGDESGTHKKEKELWKLAEINPDAKWHLEAGQGMAQTLWIAYNKGAYCLVDKGTYISYKNKIDLVILCEGDAKLFNPYSVIAVSPYVHPHVNYIYAAALIKWLISPEAQKIIGNFKKNGETLFYPNAE